LKNTRQKLQFITWNDELSYRRGRRRFIWKPFSSH